MRKKLALGTLVGSLLVSALSAQGCGSTSSGEQSTAPTEVQHFAQMTVEEVAAGLAASDRRLAVFDANSRETYDTRHVPGATWVDYDALTREQLPEDASTPLVFYCFNEHCSASHVAAESAVAMGFSNVSVMGAGIAGWAAAGQPVESAATPSAPSTTTGTTETATQ